MTGVSGAPQLQACNAHAMPTRLKIHARSSVRILEQFLNKPWPRKEDEAETLIQTLRVCAATVKLSRYSLAYVSYIQSFLTDLAL